MMNPRLIREQDAQLQFEVLAWLMQTHGSPSRPAVPSPLHKSPGLETLVWDEMDTRSIFDWAEDSFSTIKTACGMEKTPVQLVPAGDGLDPSQLEASHRLNALASGRNLYTAGIGEPIYYDPRDCVEPGYFTARTVLQLADIQVQNFRSEQKLSPVMHRMVTLTSAAYLRQGFVLANLPHEVAAFMTAPSDFRAVPQRIVLNTLCFATCLALRVRRQSTEQILATYGTRMSKTFRRKVKQACRQIDANESSLSVLQILAEPRPIRAQNPYQLKQIA